MAVTPLSSLPNDILVEILVQVKRASETNQNLVSCLLVSRRWNISTTPILYGNIALKHSNLDAFVEQLSVSKYGSHVRSVTISLQPSDNISQAAQLVPLLAQLNNLLSFSLWLSKDYSGSFSQTTLVRLLNALPVSCTNLEIDTHGCYLRAQGEQVHLCDVIRKVLPRMQHVRFRVRACERLFTEPSDPNNQISLPNIRTLIVNCSRPPGLPLATCEVGDNVPKYHGHPDLAWTRVTSGLEKLVDTEGAVPKDAKIYAFITSDWDDNDRSLWQAHIRADMVAKESWALPHRSIWMEAMIRGSWLIRLPNRQELMSTSPNIEALAEGRLWREVVGGARLPAAILEDERLGKSSFATGCVETPLAIKTSQQWRQDNPKKSSPHWYNEGLTGMRLVEPDKRSGKDRYLSLDQIREFTPLGWNRVGMNDVLERAETRDLTSLHHTEP